MLTIKRNVLRDVQKLYQERQSRKISRTVETNLVVYIKIRIGLLWYNGRAIISCYRALYLFWTQVALIRVVISMNADPNQTSDYQLRVMPTRHYSHGKPGCTFRPSCDARVFIR